MEKWNCGSDLLATRFKQQLRRVEAWIEERHEGVWGSIVSVWDSVTGLPAWVVDEYDRAEQTFAGGVCDLVREISTDVNGVVAACEAIIAAARRDIAALFANLPDELRDWATQEQARFAADLDTLQATAIAARDDFNRDLIQRARQSVQEVREEIHALREKAGGLIGRVLDAVGRFLEDPAKFIIEGLLELVGIPPASFWAVIAKIRQVIDDIANDPLGFAANLLAAVGRGFQQFFDRIGQHLLDGLLDWLFSGLGAVGVSVPSDFSLKSVVTFFLELMGITWERIRTLLAKHLGEENVALVEKAYEIVSNLIALGPEGVFEMIKEKLDPQSLLDQVLRAAVDFLVEALIRAASVRILALFNPAGAILQALEAVYRVLKWIFENAARLFRFVETIVNGIADIVAGNIGGMASAVESALSTLISPVIDFLADYIGLGDLPDRIRETIEGFQAWVESILDRVIGFLADRARALLRSLGIGGEEEAQPEGPPGFDDQIGEPVPFSGGGESHRLYIVSNDSDTQVMVRSDPTKLGGILDEWAGQAEQLADATQKQETLAAIASARQVGQSLDAAADSLRREIDSDQRRKTQAKDLRETVKELERQLGPLLGTILDRLGLGAADYGTQEQPLPLVWPKRRAAAYPHLFYVPPAAGGPLMTQRRPAQTPFEEYEPLKKNTTPAPGAKEFGIERQYQLDVGTVFNVTKPGGTGGGHKINDLLRPYGFDPTRERMDGDHVLERQLGGPDEVQNLWPLDSGENRSGGSTLASMTFAVAGRKEPLKMKDVKTDAEKRPDGVWFKIVSTR
jgi:hypothetical protein